MITPDEIIGKLERQYSTVLEAWLRGVSLFPLSLPVGQIPKKDFLHLRNSVEALKASSKEQLGYGYRIEWESVNIRGADRQTLPIRILIETEADYFRLLRRKREFEDFVADVELIRARLPELNAWIETNPLQVIKHHEHWNHLLAVCEYFKANPLPNLFVRELPVAIHTKFIEDHIGILRQMLDCVLWGDFVSGSEADFARRYGLRYDEPLVRFRLLDSTLLARLSLPFTDLSVSLSAFSDFDLSAYDCIIVENKMNFLTLPAMTNAFGIFGSGFKVDVLSKVEWLFNCSIYYWGDLDAQGFQILSMLRSIFPHVSSLMMDDQTITRFSDRVREGRASKTLQLPFLTLEERALYEQLVLNNWRLEQEQIDYSYAIQQIAALPR